MGVCDNYYFKKDEICLGFNELRKNWEESCEKSGKLIDSFNEEAKELALKNE